MEVELVVLSLVGLCLMTLLCSSIAIWVWAIVQFISGGNVLPQRFRSGHADVPLLPVSLVLLYITIGLWSLISRGQNIPFDPIRMEQAVDNSLIEGVIGIAVLWALVLGLSKRSTDKHRLGLRGDGRIRQLADGFLGFVAALAPVMLVNLLTIPFRSLEELHPFLRLIQERGIDIGLAPVAFAAIVIAPLQEELMFRVILQNWLIRWVGVNWGIGITAALFALVHGFPDAVGILPLAVILGVVYHWRRSYVSVVVLHATFNAFNVGLLVAQIYAEPYLKTLEAAQ